MTTYLVTGGAGFIGSNFLIKGIASNFCKMTCPITENKQHPCPLMKTVNTITRLLTPPPSTIGVTGEEMFHIAPEYGYGKNPPLHLPR